MCPTYSISHRFSANYSPHVTTLNRLLRGKSPWPWNPAGVRTPMDLPGNWMVGKLGASKLAE